MMPNLRAKDRVEEPSVPTSAYAILGLLSFGERSGYDLGKFAAQSVGYFFSPAKSQVYAELRRLVRLGYAAEREVRQRRRPDKRLYRITPAGERALRGWLERPEIEPEVFRSPFTLRVFFGHLADPDTLLARLVQARDEAKARLDEYKGIERRIKDEPEMLFPYLTLKAGMAHAKATIRWTEEGVDLLTRKGTR